MREQLRDKERLSHILKACDVIDITLQRFNMDYDAAVKDPVSFYCLVKNIEIIGEAAYMLTPEYKQAHGEVEWRVIEGMRHKIVHDYYNISSDIVRSTLEENIPELRIQIQQLFDEE